MQNLYINSEFFDFKKSKSKYLFSSLKKLSDSGYIIHFNGGVFENRDYLKVIFKNENIKYRLTSDSNGKEVIGSKYKNLNRVLEKFGNNRHAEIIRITNETDILIKLNLDGTGKSKIKSGIGFFDHMLDQIARHANIDLEMNIKGDLYVDEHHTVEDTGRSLGEAILQALGNKKGIQRYGFFIPMDESAAVCTIDLSGRSYLNFDCRFKRERTGSFPTELTEEFFRALSNGMKANIYLKAKGSNDHHKIESLFKAFAKSLNEACRMDERNKNILPSTKGIL